MSDSADRPFRWEDLDPRLISPKTTELAEEMHKRITQAEHRIHFEVSQSGNSAGYLPRLFDFHEELINEYAEKLYALHCEACNQQSRKISPEFIRSVRDHEVLTMIAARTSAVRSGEIMRGVRTGKPPNSSEFDRWNQRMDRLAHRWSSRLEADAVACEYREAAKKASDSPGPNQVLSSPVKPLDWERITPGHIVPAIKHIRESFDTCAWNCSSVTQKYCYAALHPKEVGPSSIAPYKDAFATCLTMIGQAADKRFSDLYRMGTPPAIFKAFFDVLLKGLELEVRKEFDQFLEIGRANAEALNTHPVEWAKTHLRVLISAEASGVRKWIKEACDKRDQFAEPATDTDIDEQIFWKAWRAPRLIHMQPSGNTAYDQATEWAREDEPRTQSLLDSLSRRFLQFLEIDLDQTVGDAHVKLAKNAKSLGILKHETQRRPVRAVAQAPPPPTLLGGSGFVPRGPEPSGAITWDGVEIEFISEERVQVRNGAAMETLNYTEFGFEDSRDGKPNRAWVVLRIMAEQRGTIRQAREAGQSWPKVEKRVQEIRRALRAHFGISDDPIPFVDGTGYRASFKISCRPSYHA